MLKNAIRYMLLSTISFTFLTVLVKYLTDFSTYQIVFFRSAGSLVFSMAFLLRNKISIYGNNKSILIIRGFIGLISMGLFFASLKHLPIGPAVTIRYIAPIFATFFAIIFLKEKVKHIQWLFLAMAFLGVVILKGFDAQISTFGFILAIVGSIFSGLVFIIIRKIGDSEHPIVIINYFMAIATIVGGILSINNWTSPHGYEWLLLASLGIFGFFGQLYMTKAFQETETNQVAPLKYMEVIFTIIFGVIWFKETYTLWSLLGIFLILVGLTLNILAKNRKTRLFYRSNI